MDPDIVEELNEQFREMSDILGQQNTLMAAQVRHLQAMAGIENKAGVSVKNNTDATNDNTKATKDLTDEQRKAVEESEKLNKSITKVTQAFTPFVSALLDSTQGLKKYSDAAGQFGQTMADVGKNSGSIFGVIFGHLTDFATKLTQREILNTESLLKFNDEVSKFGAVNRFTTEQIREMGHRAALSAQDIGVAMESMKKLGPAFTSMGQGAADSTRKFMDFIAFSEDERRRLRLMGYETREEMIEASSMYLDSMNSMGLSIRMLGNDTDKLRNSSLAYLENLTVLADMTGVTVKEQQDQLKALKALREFNIYVANTQAKIDKTTDEQEKERLRTELQKAQLAVGAAQKTGGNIIAGGLVQEMMMGFSNIDSYYAQGALLQTSELFNDIRRAVKDETVSQEAFAKHLSNFIKQDQNTRMDAMANDTFAQIAMLDRNNAEIFGFGADMINQASIRAGLKSEEVGEETRSAIEALQKDLGPAAEDAAQKLRAFAAELEIKTRIGLDNLQKDLGLMLQAVAAGAFGLLSVGTGVFMARKLGRLTAAGGTGLGAGTAAGAAGAGAAGLGAASSQLPRTPNVLLDGGTRYSQTAGGIYMPEGTTAPETPAQRQTRMERLRSRFAPSGRTLSRLGRGLAGGVGGLLGGYALDYASQEAAAAGHSGLAGGLDVGSSALMGAGLGATVGSIIPGVGTLIGGGVGALAGGAYGLYQNRDRLFGGSGSGARSAADNLVSPEQKFARATNNFGRLVTSFGRVVTVFAKANKMFASNTKTLNAKLSELNNLSFGGNNNTRLLGTLSEDNQDDLVDYIKKLKTEFSETARVTNSLRGEEEVRHKFNEISMLSFRNSLDKATEKLKEFSEINVFGGDEGASGHSGTGSGKPFTGGNKEFYDTMYNTLLESARKQGVENPEAIARLGAAQSALETGYGKKAPGNNYFGIKGGGGPTLATEEVIDGKRVKTRASFRQYGSMQESADDYIRFLIENPRYKAVLSAKNAEEAIAAQARTGYATDPDYGKKLSDINRRGMASGASQDIAEFAKQLQREFGVEASRHSAFDGTTPTGGHAPNSKHYKDLAVDINAPGGIREWDDPKWRATFDRIAEKAREQGYKVFWGDKNHRDHIHIEANKVRAAQGGVFDGPKSGYPAELHGSEMVAPLDTNSILMKLAKTPAASSKMDMIAQQTRVEKEIVEKISNSNNELIEAFTTKMDAMIEAIADGNDTRDKMFKSSMI
jgi:flagellum-specific peptidoglycan hydrolase FlgJ